MENKDELLIVKSPSKPMVQELELKRKRRVCTFRSSIGRNSHGNRSIEERSCWSEIALKKKEGRVGHRRPKLMTSASWEG